MRRRGARRRAGRGSGAMPRKKPFSVKQKKKQLQDKRERKRGQGGGGAAAQLWRRAVPRHRGRGVGGWALAIPRGLPRWGFPAAAGRGGVEGGGWETLLLLLLLLPQGAVTTSRPIRDGVGARGWEDGASGEVGSAEEELVLPARGALGPLRTGLHRRHRPLPSGLQDGLRSSSNSRSGSRERREEQTDTSDGESVTHHIRRLNQQPSQGLGPRGYDPNR